MSIAAIVRAMVASGCTPGQILAAVEAAEASSSDAISARRANDAERQRRKRSNCHVTSRDVTVTPRDESDASEPRAPARVVIPLEVKKDTLPTHPSDAPVPMPRKAHQPLPEGWPEDAFDRWWAVYPRRVAKGDAEKAFVAAAKRGDTTFDGIMAATHRFARPPPDPQFTPYPATWLNGKRYLDEQAGSGLFERPRGSARDPTGHAAYLALLDPRPADDGGFGRGPVVDHWPPDRH